MNIENSMVLNLLNKRLDEKLSCGRYKIHYMALHTQIRGKPGIKLGKCDINQRCMNVFGSMKLFDFYFIFRQNKTQQF